MRDRSSLERNLDQTLASLLRGLTNSVRNLNRLTESESYVPTSITCNNERAEAESASALYYFGYTVDEYSLVGQLAALINSNSSLVEDIFKSHTSPN
jgi:hypothetical protein